MLKLVSKERLKFNGKIKTETINGKAVKVLYLKEGVHTTTHPIIDLTK